MKKNFLNLFSVTIKCSWPILDVFNYFLEDSTIKKKTKTKQNKKKVKT